MAENSALDALKKQQEESAKKSMENFAKHHSSTKVESKTYYSNVSGSTHIFTNGAIAKFVNGEYVTNREAEIRELNELCETPGNHHIFDHQVPIQNYSDAIIPKEVGGGGGARTNSVQPTTVNGIMSTAHINNLAQQ